MTGSRLLFVSNEADVAERVELDVATNDMKPVSHIYPADGPIAYCGFPKEKDAAYRGEDYTGPEERDCKACLSGRIERWGW